MLTLAEIADARDQLRQAENIMAGLRARFLSSAFTLGGRVALDLIGLIGDIIRALDTLEQKQRSAAGQGQP